MADTYIPKIALTTEEKSLILTTIHTYLPESKVYIFGSRVKGSAKKFSDVDIALDNYNLIPGDILIEIQVRLVKTLNI